MNGERFIRFAARHVDEIHAIEKASFTLPWARAAFLEVLASPSFEGTALVDAAGAVLGYAVTCEVAEEFQLLNIAVAPAARGKGAGAKLLAELHRAAAARGRTEAFLEVRAGNAAAIALYARFGYVPYMRRPKYYPDTQEDAILMRATLKKL